MTGTLLLTGADGFIGSAVRDLATQIGVPLHETSRRPKPGDRHVDVLLPETLAAAMVGVTTVIHAAGAAHVFRQTAESEAWMRRTNIEGTRNVVNAARVAGVRHVVLVSSVAVYGGFGASATESAPSAPEGVYAESKLEAERAAIDAAGNDVALTILRVATVYGEGDRGNVFRLIRAIDRGRFVWVGRGDNRKSLIHRDDVATAILLAAQAKAEGVETFNVSAPAVAMHDVVTTIANALGRTLPRWRISAGLTHGVARALSAATLCSRRAVALERTIARWNADDIYDGSAFRDRFGFRPTVELAEGVAREVAWYRASRRVSS